MPGALVVVDMLNTYGHADGERLAEHVGPTIEPMRAAIAEARAADQPVIYVNDHYGDWRGRREALIDHVLRETIDQSLVEPVLPADTDRFIFKARHSIFYETSLEYLLGELDCTTITLVGQVTEQCILYSALDAHVRHLDVRVVADAVAAIDDELAEAALRMMADNMGAEVVRAG